MKTRLLLLLSILFFSFSLNLMVIAAADPVLDINGDPLQPGRRYYIVSAINAALGGGLKLQRPRLLVPCPPILVQSPSDFVDGDPWTLLHQNRRGGPILEFDTINIHSDFSQLCLQNTWWSVSNTEDTETGSYLIGIVNSRLSNFYIQRFGFAYKLVYQGFDNNTSSVGQKAANGLIRLVLNDDFPIRVVFRKADDLKANLQQM